MRSMDCEKELVRRPDHRKERRQWHVFLAVVSQEARIPFHQNHQKDVDNGSEER